MFGWFASWHTFWPVTLAWLMRKPSIVVIGGYDTANMPEIPYGVQGRGLMRLVSRWVMRRATRLLANSNYSREEAAANAGVDPSRVTVVHHGVPDPFGELPQAERERMALTVGIVDRRNVAAQGTGHVRAGGRPAARCRVRAGGTVGRRRRGRAARGRDAERDAHRLGRGGAC